MRLIGLCGRSGSGKSLFASLAEEAGLKVLNCDKIYKELVSYLSPCLMEISQHFGREATKDNALNRRYLAPIVFSDKEKLALLNAITHKHITKEIEDMLSTAKENDIYILDAPTLFESGLQSKCDIVLAVISPLESCVERITQRDKITAEEAESRLNSQYSNEFLIEHCDIIIYNDATLSEYESACKSVISQIKEGIL